jgi:hypothetical protein
MNSSKLIGLLTAFLGALLGVFVCAVVGVDFSASSKSESFQKQVESGSGAPTNITQFSPTEIQLSEVQFQIQSLKNQLASCSAESSRLRMDALTNQMNQQRR